MPTEKKANNEETIPSPDQANQPQKKDKTQKKDFEDNLKDPVYVNYHLLLKLEELKKIGLAQLELERADLKVSVDRLNLEGAILDVQRAILEILIRHETEGGEKGREGIIR